MNLLRGTDKQLAANVARQPKRSKAGGLVLIVVSPILAALLFLILYAIGFTGQLLVLGGLFLLMGALAGIRTGRRLRAPDAAEVLRRDPRPPIVFLRPFNEDHRLVYGSPIGPREGGEQPVSSKGETGHEQTLAHLLRGAGPFIAIGQPGEKLVTLGAARWYVSDADWQNEVEAMVRRAGAVVLQPELSSGTMWEVDLVARAADLMRLLLIVPNPRLRPLRYWRIRELAHERLSVVLPTADECAPCDAFYFDDSRNPVPLSLDTPSLLIRLPLPERVWKFLSITKEARAASVAGIPPMFLRSSKDLVRQAKPFLDRLDAKKIQERATP
jgi:hypothetical protein